MNDDGIAKYFTADQTAEILGIDREKVYEIARKKLVRPALTKGAHQYDRAGLARIAVYDALQSAFGKQSEVPATVLRDHAEDIDRIDPARDDVTITITTRSSIATVEVPLGSRLRDAIKRVPA